MLQILADRFLPAGELWIDFASGTAVRVRLAPAGTSFDQLAWNDRCAVLANLRHPLVNPLLDYGMADAQRTFEAYAVNGPVRAAGGSAAALLEHAVRFLAANGVVLPRPLADYVLRTVAAGSTRRMRPFGVSLQPRRVFDAIRDALETASPAGACAVAIAGEAHSGLRTLRLAAARTARLEGYLPVAASMLRRRGTLAALADRHVCLIAGEERGEQQAVANILAGLGAAGARRHVLLSFGRGSSQRPAVHVDRMGIVAMTEMVFVDREHGPTPEQLFDAARESEGRPGQFLARLGSREEAVHPAFAMAVHETAQPYTLAAAERARPALVRKTGRQPAALHRAAERGEVLARAGRHGAAARLLQRAVRVLAARGEYQDAARCCLRLGWLSIQRAQLAAAVESFDRVRGFSPDGATSVSAAIGTGVAWTDAGRLTEAEAALRTCALAAQKLEDATLSTQALAGLARCLLWQGRGDEAAAVLRGVTDAHGSAREQARAYSVLARVHLAEKATATAIRTARQALERATDAGDPCVLAAVFRVLAQATAAGGDTAAAAQHVREGLSVAARAHLPLETVRLRLTLVEVEAMTAASSGNCRLSARLAAASGRYPPLLRFRVRAVRSRVEGVELDTATRAFIETSGAAAVAQPSCATASSNPVADLEAFLHVSQTATDDRTAIDRVSEQLRARLRAATVMVIGPEPGRRVLAICGRPWHGDPVAAWRALASGFSVPIDLLAEPCQAAEPLRYSGEIIGSITARWIAGSPLDPPRAGALLRVGALVVAASVRAILDRTLPAAPAHPCTEILGDSVPARSMRDAIARAARAPFPVLIEGESGSGKELVAQAIHRLGARRDRRFCAINCAALSDDLLEAELFGHARGAFTGAVGDRAGLFEEADGGTLFLDEIGELSARAQAKLLRVLQDGQVRRVGENTSRRVDVRIVAATNRRLAQEAAAGRFRADLRFRLDVVRIEVPPLRDRAGDVPLLASSFWADAAARMGSRATLSPEALAALARYHWPGNVRELQNVIAWIAVHSPTRGRIPATAVPGHVAQAMVQAGGTFESARSEFERRFLEAALAAAGGHRARAAEALGITRQGLAKMLRRLSLE